jgi:serine phosphatase RsbU (regulator of sigma subunit)/ligand-binding sensor domain-containing protein
MKYLLKLLVLTFCLLNASYGQEVFYPITNYTPKEYGRDFHPTNMSVVQDKRGIVYAANGFKLLEYDGSRWKSYPINKETWILSLATGNDGLIYAGSQIEFGYFAPALNGNLKYRSLSDSLDQNEIGFTNIWKVLTFSGGVVFQAEEKIFIYRNGRTEVINPQTSFHTSFVVNDRLFVRQRETGLMELKDKNLIRIKGGELFDTTGIFVMLPYGKNRNKILIGTRDKGFWWFDSSKNEVNLQKFYAEDSDLLKKSIITDGIVTGDGLIAIGTMRNGIIVMDTTGKTKTIINTGRGLNDNDVKNIMLDQSKNLWVALNNGISMIGISSPVSQYNEKSGITGSINTVIRYNDLLYAGTTTGLFVQTTGNDSPLPFKPVAGLSLPVRSLSNTGRVLLAGTDAGIYKISGNTILKIDTEESYTLFYSPELKILFSGGPKGMRAYRSDASFSKINSLNIDGEDIIGISAEKNPVAGVSEFWIGTRYNGVIRIKINKDLSFISERYGKPDGLPDGPVVPASVNSNSAFETIQGLYAFTNENIVQKSLPDSLKNNKDFLKGYFSMSADNYGKTGGSVSFLTEDKDKIWICSDNRVGFFSKEEDTKFITRPFSGIDAGKINVIYPEDNGVCWIGATEGLIRYDEKTLKDYDQIYSTLVREVKLLDNDSSVYMGSGVIGPGKNPVLNYSDNSVRFDFSATFYEYPVKMLYSYMLDGRNLKWSQWSSEIYQEFTNLKEGEYTFVVKARNIYGTEGTPARYSFKILPPWYRSVEAYFAYAIIALILFWLSARLYAYRLQRENLRLEGIITERTAEIVRQKDEIVHKNSVLEHQKKEIEDSIRYAQRIQSAVIPSEKVCHEIIPDSFVFFRPLNIVSGDFYWISRVGNRIIYAVADCTGHGVPGAFMSMLGVAFLNEIVNKDNVLAPDLILNQLREKVVMALQQHGISGESRDGMDIALVTINLDESELEFSGAYNPLVLIRNGEIIETPGEKMPIGFYENMHPFKKNDIKILKGDVFYMASDGFEDQFGGPDGKKFKAKQFKQLLLEIHKQPMEKQKEILEKSFEQWKGDLPQVDDVVVVGLTIV